ncbi:PEP/pyruvate-binding domain-containing protein [Proteiniclasticum sp.]|uniref:PEP/pyruvate-binding domain-containing protein n=1 Tax=Proteiniclasticum sp. TaxID=2053595 RepID=UPI0028975448|nr:PEP/pyruvate-binding domain-containing protein [Proteiniclasticum sp.]
MREKYLYSLEDLTLGNAGGNKTKNLQFLMRKRYPVPKGCVVSFFALNDYQAGNENVIGKLRSELKNFIQQGQTYAVRSSASVEDHNEFSCAGLFQSYLGISGEDEIIEAVLKVWQSLYDVKLLTYCKTHDIDTQSILMAVIIQEMVEARSSGVIFTKNPITGFSEIIIEAGEGTGDDQVSAMKNPERWVSKWGNWIEKPETRIISEEFADQLIENAYLIAKAYGKPVDLEWAYDGENCTFFR